MWVFGYGSLVWYTNFPYVKSMPGCLRGYARRFWQASPDHRGTHEKPGRTVTLIKQEDSCVWGIAYQVSDADEDKVRKYLAWREKAGYEAEHIAFYPHPEMKLQPFLVEVFISPDVDNIYFIGPEKIADTAEIIVNSTGPSGTNIEYVLRLANCLKKFHFSAEDEYLSQLENKVVELCKTRGISDPTLTEFGYI